MIKAVGLALVVVGVGLGYWGYDMAQGLGAQLSSKLSGSIPDAVIVRYIGGAAAFVAGLVLLVKK